MFPDFDPDDVSEDQAAIELAAHGMSVIEVRRRDDSFAFEVVVDSDYNRHITALRTEHLLTGPAAGNDLLKTAEDSTGTRVIGTLNNCAGGKTPWGTVLSAEENFDLLRRGEPAARHRRGRRRGGTQPRQGGAHPLCPGHRGNRPGR